MKKQILILILLLTASSGFAQDALEIMRKVDNRDDGRTIIAGIRLTTYRYAKKDGKNVAIETPRIKRLEFVKKDYGPREKDHKSVSIVLEPKSERGIGFLQYDYAEVGKDTDQWMYLSALGKVKRIVAGNDNEPKTGSFFGTEFNYEDMEAYLLDDYTYKLLGSEVYRTHDCWVIQALPVPRKALKSNYSRAMIWVDKKRDLILKSVLFNRNGKKNKKVYYADIVTIDGILVSKKITMNNIITKRRTVMEYERIAVNRAVEDIFLSQRTLVDKGFREKKLTAYRNEL